MNKLPIAMTAILLLLAGCEQGSYFNDDTVQIRANAVSRLEAQGFDLRVYEFTPRSRPDQDCIFVAGDGKAGLWCLPKIPDKGGVAVNP